MSEVCYMKKRVQFTVYVLFMCCFLGWLIFSNSIITSFVEETPMKKSDLNLANLQKDIAVGYIDEVAPFNDIFERISIVGWAFVETRHPNSERRISIILRSSDSYYTVDAHSTRWARRDVLKAYPQAPSAAVGFGNVFSVLEMKDGLYKAYLSVRENDINYGLIDTNEWYKKEGSHFTKFHWQSESTEQPVSSSAVQTAGYLDIVAKEGDSFVLKGWITIDGVDASRQTTAVYVTDQSGKTIRYTTQPVERPDVAVHFGNELYRMAGYQAAFPPSDWADGELTAVVCAEHDGKTFRSEEYKLMKSGDSLERIESPN